MPPPIIDRPRLPSSLANPAIMRPIPSSTRPAPTSMRRRSDVSVRATSSRIAATGAMCEARRAGRYAATMVTTTPTPKEAQIVRSWIPNSAPDRSSPKMPNSDLSPSASR